MIHKRTRGILVPNNLTEIIGRGDFGNQIIDPTVLRDHGMTFHNFKEFSGGRWLAPNNRIIPPAHIYCLATGNLIKTQLLIDIEKLSSLKLIV
jgi:hypothetical protein